MGKLDGKVAIITGGARGMGAAHVRTFINEGAKEVFGDLLEQEGLELQRSAGPRSRFMPHDVTDERAWEEIVKLAVVEFGTVDVLVNNAGILRSQSIDDMTAQDFRQVLEINVVSQWLGIKVTAPAMGDRGSIVNVSSVNGIVGAAKMTAYSASKFASRGVTRSAALELGPKGIRVNSVHPGGVATPMIGRGKDDLDSDVSPLISGLPVPRYASPDEVAKVVLFLASDDASYCTGSEFVVDGGMTAGAGF